MIHKSEAALHIKLLNTNTLYTSKREVLFKLMILITTKSFELKSYSPYGLLFIDIQYTKIQTQAP